MICRTFATRVAITAVLLALLLLISPVSADDVGAVEDPANAVPWDVKITSQTALPLGADTVHISEITWWTLLVFGFLMFLASLKWTLEEGSDILAGISTVIFGFLSVTGFCVQTWSYEVVTLQLNETAQVYLMPVVYTQPPWTVLITIMMLFIGVINLYRIHVTTLVNVVSPKKIKM